MLNPLDRPRLIAEGIRYSGDKALALITNKRGDLTRVRDAFYREGLKISKKTTPLLAEKLEQVCKRLQIPTEAVDGFVYASADLQAECYSTGGSQCILRFTSALVELLSGDELTFVAGHELGHFLLDHSAIHETESRDPGFFLQQRCQEVSADRMGLVGCGSLDVAVRALMKTVSGLNERHLSFNVGEFISQLKQISGVSAMSLTESHPPMVMRCRALLWFSMSTAFTSFPTTPDKNELLKLDERIIKDLDNDVNGLLRQQMDECKKELRLWLTVQKIVDSGKFGKNEQAKLSEIFDQSTVEKLKGFLASLTNEEAKTTVLTRVHSAKSNLNMVSANTFAADLRTIQSSVDEF